MVEGMGQGEAVALVEAHLIGALLHDPGEDATREDLYFMASELVEPRQFWEPVFGDLFAAIGEMIELGGSVVVSNLAARFEDDTRLAAVGCREYLDSLKELGEPPYNRPSQVRYMADVVKLQYGLRTISWAMDEAKERLEMAPTLENIRDELGSLIQNMVNIDEMTGAKRSTLAKAGQDRMERLLKQPTVPDSTGLPGLDEAMAGGLYPGRVYGVVARKKVGKSALGGTISGNLEARNVPHAVFLLEMGIEMYADRAASRALAENSTAFLQVPPDPKLINRGADYFAQHGHTCYLIDAAGWTLTQIIRELHALKKQGIRGFILDYMQLVQGRENRQTTAEFQETVANELALTCRSLGLWGLAFAQQNQEGNVRGGEGLRLAFDQVYFMAPTTDGSGVWLAMTDTRYTMTKDVGTKYDAGLVLNQAGPHFVEPRAEPAAADDLALDV